MQLDILFNATSFAVVGASSDTKKVGHQILHNLSQNKNLALYPVNPKGGTILGYRVYDRLDNINEKVDIVVIAVKAPLVSSIIDQCIKIKPKAVILISAGFAELGDSGLYEEKNIAHKLSTNNIALLGPNTMGYLSPHTFVNASFAATDTEPGDIALISQSGAMLSSFFSTISSKGLGVSFAISLGNKEGITEVDCLEHALNDHHTKVIAIYLESVSDPLGLLSIARKTASKKPIYFLAGGITKAGQIASSSHTASHATSPTLLSALCLQAGITKVQNFEQLVSATIMTSKLKHLPQNVMVVTNAGGLAVTLTDQISTSSLKLAELSSGTHDKLKNALPQLQANNPLDLLGDATADTLHLALDILSVDHNLDSLVLLLTRQSVTDLEAITTVLQKPHNNHKILICLSGGDDMQSYKKRLQDLGYMVFDHPNEIIEALSLLSLAHSRLGQNDLFRAQSQYSAYPYPTNYTQLEELLKSLTLRFPKKLIIENKEGLTSLTQLKYPLIAKTANLSILHKLKSHALIMDIISQQQAEESYEKLKELGPVLFQEKVKPGIELLIGTIKDPDWGFYLTLGLGGSISDALNERAYIFSGAQVSDVEQAISSTKLKDLLSPSTVHKLSQLALNFLKIAESTSGLNELEINPITVVDDTIWALDIKRR